MSAILLGKNPLESMLDSEEAESKQKNSIKDDKEQIIKGKNKTYVISKTLGKGTFGKVKLAYNQENPNEKYACKILLKSNIKDEDDNLRCKREMDILKKMHHVNVVRTYEIISTDTTYYIFMDFCAKGELFNYIVVKQRLSTKKSAFFYYQLINGIEYIHKKGVCHRDLKPENLLLTEKNKLKIIDFGLSNYFNGNLLETPCGSPCYASPEMVRGHKYDGFKIDIWSSGIILYAMLCGYLPFEEMENDDCNEVLFKNIMECNVEYPPEFIPPEAKSLLKRILVKDPRRRITIEEIKMENFYLLGEIIYKQTFENLGNFDLNDYIYCIDEKDKFYNFDEYPKNESNDNLLAKEYLYFNEKMRKNQEDLDFDLDKQKSIKKDKEKEKEKDLKKDKEKDKDNEKDLNKEIQKDKEFEEKDKDIVIQKTEPNKFMTPIKSEGDENIEDKNKKSIKKNIINYDKDEMTEKTQKMTAEKKSQKHQKHFDQKEQIENKENINSQKLSEKKNTTKTEKQKLTNENQIKKISPDMLCNIPIITCSNEKKETKDDKLKKEYSLQEEYNKIHNENSNINLNYKDINIKSQYLKTEIYPSNLRSKTKPKKNNYKLLNKKKTNNNLIAFDNIIRILQNKNTQKTKTLKPYSTKKNAPVKSNINNKTNQSNSLNKKKYCSYSPGIKKVSKNGKNLINNIEKNINFPRQNNYYPLTTHENIKNNYNMLSNDIMKYFNSNIFLKNKFNNNYNEKNKSFKPNKKFIQYKENKPKYINNLNTFNNENYFRINNNIKNKNNDEKKFVKYSLNNALNFKSFEYYAMNNISKRNNNIPIEKKINNENKHNKDLAEINDIYNNNNITNNLTNINKKSLGNLKGTPYIENIFNDNTKPILINTSCVRKNTEVNNNRNRKNLSTNRKINSNNNKIRLNSKNNSRSKNKNKNKKSLSHKMNHVYNKDNIDNNIIINFNILKPNIILDHQKSSSRKLKTNKYVINNKALHHNIFTNKIDRPITESNFCSTVRSNFFNKSNKNRQNYFKNIDMKQLKKNKEINQIIRSIHDLNKK